MKKNVLVIHRGYPLGSEAGDKVRTLNMASSLNNLGYNVVLLGFYTKGFTKYMSERASLPSNVRGVFIYTFPNRLYMHKIASFYRAVITWMICKIYSIDIIQAELASAANASRFVSKLPLITDFHSDIVPELEMDQYSRYLIEHAASENSFALKHSAKTITVSETLSRNLSIYGKSSATNFILPCNFNAQPFLVLNPDIRMNLRKEYGIEDRIVLCYSGGLHSWQCICETLDLVIRLRKLNPSYFLCLFTNDTVTPYISLLEQLDDSFLVKGLKREEMPAYLSMTDVGFVLRGDSLVNVNSSPTKTSEYLAAGAMVIATKYAGDAPMQILESTCGLVLEDLSVSDSEIRYIDEQIVAYAADYDSNARKAREYVFKNRIWASNEAKLLKLYNELDQKK